MSLKNKEINLSPPRLLVAIFIIFIVIGTLLLKLPFATTQSLSWLDSFFTATSAMTVTGLVVVDTGQAFTLFGQIVILLLIQVGGLGIMTFAVLIFLALGRKIGIKERILIQQALNQNSIGGVVRLVKRLLAFSLIMEGIVAFLLTFRWGPEMGWLKGIYAAIFHSISAFNNAGFSIWSDSLSQYVADPIVNILISLLFIIGGLGFTVIFDLWEKSNFRDFSLHTKITVLGTIFINIAAFIIVLSLEYNNPNTIGNLSSLGKIQAAYFQAVVPRTAGFNTVDIGSLNDSTLFFMLFLMFIGAGSTSTGGGIKITTFLALIFSTLSFLRNKSEIVIFKRAISDKTIVRALAITMISFFVIFIGTFILDMTEDAPFLAILFEIISAFGTVGLSMGITAKLSIIGKLIIALVMFVGKLGPLTLAFSLSNQDKTLVQHPKEEILTG